MTAAKRFLTGLLCAGLLIVEPARAADHPPDPKKAEAAERFDRGLTMFDEGDNAGALAEFKRTYELMPNAVVRYNIGLVYAAMGRPVDAVAALEAVVGAEGLSTAQRERAVKTLAEQKARIGRLIVTTKPEGARIEVDNVEVAKTPLSTPLLVAAGNHIVGVVAEGHQPARKEVTVAGNSDAALHFDLVLMQGKRLANLTVRSRIAGADVIVDGQLAGKTPLASSLTLTPGRHAIEVKRPGYTPIKQETDLGEGATGELSFDLRVEEKALAAEGASLALAVSEPNAVLFVDGERLGSYSGPVRLPRGSHRIRLEAPGFMPFERELTLEPSQSDIVNANLEPTPQTRAEHESNVRFHRTWGWIGIAGGAVIAGAGGGFLAINASAITDAQRDHEAAEAVRAAQTGICDISGGADVNECNAFVSERQAAIDDAEARDLIGYVGLGVGAAVLITGVVILVSGDDADRFERSGALQKQNRRGLSWWARPSRTGGSLGLTF